MLPARGALIAGVSGGADSVALLYLLYACLPDASQRLHVVHVHHGMRAKEADRDMRLVMRHCQDLNIPCSVYHSHVTKIAVKRGISQETAGRLVRQDCFMDTAVRIKAKAVVLAHHQDDQVETILFNFLRGTGSRGLSGMQADRIFPHPTAPKGLRLLRPLLTIPKQALEMFLRQKKIKWRVDKSNQQNVFARNRLRLELIPLLEKKYNPLLKQRIVQNGESLRRDEALLASLTQKAMRKLGITGEETKCRIHRQALLKLPEAIQWRVLAGVWEMLGIPEKSNQHLRRVWDAVLQGRQGISLPGLWQAGLHRGILVVEKTAPKVQAAAYCMKLKKGLNQNPGVPFGVKMESAARPTRLRRPPDARHVFLDAKSVKGTLVMRTLKTGDVLSPLGMAGKKKSVRKILLEMGLSREEIETWPLVVRNHEVIWVYMGPIAESAKITLATVAAVKISVFPQRARR